MGAGALGFDREAEVHRGSVVSESPPGSAQSTPGSQGTFRNQNCVERPAPQIACRAVEPADPGKDSTFCCSDAEHHGQVCSDDSNFIELFSRLSDQF